MNKDNPIIEFSLESGMLDYVCKETNRYKDNLPCWLNDIDAWVESRNYAKHKEHFKKWLKEWGIDNKKGFIEITHALGLNDTLWIKGKSSKLTWEEVNLYNNEFTDVAEKTAFETGLAGLKLSSSSPEITAEGSFEKCWKKQQDNIYIYKKGSSGFANAGLEPYSEFYASQIAKTFDKKAVQYDLEMYKGSLCTRCGMFTSEDVGFVPFYKYHIGENTTMQKVFEACKELGYEAEFRKMIVFDSIIFNPDRHTGNFGYLIDNETFEIKAFSPLFDYNYSLLCRAMSDDFENIEAYLDTQGHKLGGSYEYVAKAFMSAECEDIIESLGTIRFQRHNKYNLEEKRLETLERILNKQAKSLIKRNNYSNKKGKRL